MPSSAHLILDFDGVISPYGPSLGLLPTANGQLLHSPHVVHALNHVIESSSPNVRWLTTREDDVHDLSRSCGCTFSGEVLELSDGLDEMDIKVATMEGFLQRHHLGDIVWIDDAISSNDLPGGSSWGRVHLIQPNPAHGLSLSQVGRIDDLLEGGY